MEHCTSRFFQECDADKDKQVSFKEWTSCFGIKNGESSSMSFTDTDKITLHNKYKAVHWICEEVLRDVSTLYPL